ncbi:MAG: threonylcarbamoyl-AMP synthase [Clostridia bacterium]|nr:threonylcarbamoyl-AMP synthase [Clostridia bacterium]
MDGEKIIEAAKVIKNGGIVLFPTETVYGIGANALNDEAVEKIFIAKGRAQDNPLILHISDREMLAQIVEDVSEMEYRLMNAFWPGPFTIILNKKEGIANVATCHGNTVGVRMPSNPIAQELIREAGVPIAAPSANISGKPSGTKLSDIFEELKDKVDYMIDGGETDIGLESTVVRVIEDEVRILRPGKITQEDIEKVMNHVEIDKNVMGEIAPNEKVLSPGMKYRHYAPKTHCKLIYSSDSNKMIAKVLSIAKEYQNVVILSFREDIASFKGYECIDIGSKNDLEEVSHHIFSALRKIDEYDVDLALIEGVEAKRHWPCHYEQINESM